MKVETANADIPFRQPADDAEFSQHAPFTFVTDGVDSAIGQAKAAAGDKDVIAIPGIAQQALNAGLLDVITVDLVP